MKKTLILILGFLCLCSFYAYPQLTILPLGNSVTQGNSTQGSYRKALWDLFQTNGISVDFVGSLNQPNGCGSWPDPAFDQDHEGHWGWKVDHILNGNGPGGPWNCRVDVLGNDLSDWLTGLSPDIALIHLGTNDAINNDPPASTITEIGQVIDILRASNPNIKIYLATLIPNAIGSYNTSINSLNALIPGLVASKNTVASPVTLVDQNTGFDANNDTYDGTHPDDSGEQKMAQKWYDAVVSTFPVGLSSFNVYNEGQNIQLKWETEWELNNQGFEIEYRRGNTEEFQKIGFVNGVGTSDEQNPYRFDAGRFSVGQHSFRLKQIDYDGKFDYSRVLEVQITPGQSYSSIVYPNPAKDQFQLEVIGDWALPLKLELRNIQGQLVWEGKQDGTASNFSLQPFHLPEGSYFLEIKDNRGKRTHNSLRIQN
ncbi:MAG: GDSL-type esterase/lipase family protein [Bacteroidota bacterium]